MIFNRTIGYIFFTLFCVPVVGMDAERVNPSRESYENNQKKLALILCVFRQENVVLPDDVGRIIAFKYAEKEIVESEELLRQMKYQCCFPVAYYIPEKKNACSVIDLLFLNKNQCCGILTMSGIANVNRLVLATSMLPKWEFLRVEKKEFFITDKAFNQAMVVPRCLREKLFAGSNSTIKVSKLVEHYEDHFDEFITRKEVFEQRSFLEDKQLCITDK